MTWRLAHRYDADALALAERHYNRQTPGSPQFCPPGRLLVLIADAAVWVTTWPKYAQHAWRGAWINSLFRNEGAGLSSELIRAAVAATRAKWPTVPELGLVTFVDPSKVRAKRDPGRCYLRAGFKHAGTTKGGLLAFQMLPADMPAAAAAIGQVPA